MHILESCQFDKVQNEGNVVHLIFMWLFCCMMLGKAEIFGTLLAFS